jgi:hypothetical protein
MTTFIEKQALIARLTNGEIMVLNFKSTTNKFSPSNVHDAFLLGKMDIHGEGSTKQILTI